MSKQTVLPRIFEPATCIDGDECDRERLKYIAKHSKSDGHIDPLPKRTFKHFCSECKSSLEHDAETGRRKVWDQLPIAFGLPCWDELAKTTFEAL